MKITQFTKIAATLLGAVVVNSAVNAGTVDQYTTASAEFAQVYQNGTSVNLTVEGAGINRTVHLSHSYYSYETGSIYWSGQIPADAVTVNGIAGVSVYVDTCTLIPRVSWGTNPCGIVDVDFTKGDYLWKTNGVRQYKWGNLIYQIVGGVSTFAAQSAGTVRGISVDSTRAFMGKYNDVSIQVTTGN